MPLNNCFFFKLLLPSARCERSDDMYLIAGLLGVFHSVFVEPLAVEVSTEHAHH